MPFKLPNPRLSFPLLATAIVLLGVACSTSGGSQRSLLDVEFPPTVTPEAVPTADLATGPTAGPLSQSSDVASGEDPTDLIAMQQESEALLSSLRELNPTGPKDVDPRLFRQLLDRDIIRPIYNPIVSTPSEAMLDSDELVMGVTIGGESRAYPVTTLRIREIANDTLGGTPILVTW